MLQCETVGNVFLVEGCEKTVVHIQETGAITESAASNQAMTQKHSNTIHQAMQKGKKKKKKKKNGVHRENSTAVYVLNCKETGLLP